MNFLFEAIFNTNKIGGYFELSLDFDHCNLVANDFVLFAIKLSAKSTGDPFLDGNSGISFFGHCRNVLGGIDGRFICYLSSKIDEIRFHHSLKMTI